MTESINPRTASIDMLETSAMVSLMLDECAAVLPAVMAVSDRVAELIGLTAEQLRRGGRLVYVGSGSSGRLGVLDAAECPPTFNSDPSQVIALLSGGEAAVGSSRESTEDEPEQGKQDIERINAGESDVVLGISASGRTPYVLGAIAEARGRGALTAGLACTAPSALEPLVDIMIAPLVGPEIIAGSTRLNAGTAQKIVLNTLSTGVMIRLGKTYGNLMVDIQPKNEKLKDRQHRIVAQAAGVSEAKAAGLLTAAGGDAKAAIMIGLTGAGVEAARAALSASDGVVRDALERIRESL
ncbi:MAG TPA: N-acetylmuramic acid 6-phosphate etherase, partial [Thermomicrobiaceae bacterium]|nr:N-acetylmuramic acid 6-phosphate etherase [Thermomicrobiaceae bacterium]